jgi:hypothetical protein
MDRLASETMAYTDRGDGYTYLRRHIAARVADLRWPLFTTDADPERLKAIFLANLPYNQQVYQCNACLDFIGRYGGLVKMDEQGNQRPALWYSVGSPPYFRQSIGVLQRYVQRARVNGVFVSNAKAWGTPETPPWTHLAGPQVDPSLYVNRPTPGEYAEDFQMLARAVHAYPLSVFAQAVAALSRLPQGGSHLSRAKGLLALKESYDRASTARQERNVLWRAAATAPAGFCHVEQTVLGHVLADIRDGVPFERIKQTFEAMVHPLTYQRPTVVKEGNIDQAEKIIERLGLAQALKRRFARLEDVDTFWQPTDTDSRQEYEHGVFAHLRKREPSSLVLPPQKMTWEKFLRTVLPGARRIEFYIPAGLGSYAALVAPADPLAPSLLKWANGVSWYCYHRGSKPETWNLRGGDYVEVTGLAYHPRTWGAHNPADLSDKLFFLLTGARDTAYTEGGAFFPTQLGSELHGSRATLEAYARTAVIAGRDQAVACGWMAEKDREWAIQLRVNGQDVYLLDRWD